MYSIVRVLPVFAACIAFAGCGEGRAEYKSRPAPRPTVVIEKPGPTVIIEKPSPTVVIEAPRPTTTESETVRTETNNHGGATTKTTTEVKTTR
jgi:hypothetical protein